MTGSGTTYNVAVSGMTGTGTVIADVGAGVAHDAAGNREYGLHQHRQYGDLRRDGSDGDDQSGGRAGGPDQRFADQLHGGVQRDR